MAAPSINLWLLFSVAFLAFLCACQATEKKHHKNSPQIFELHRDDLRIKFTNWGATILSVKVPDAKGHISDVVLGFDNLTPYMASICIFNGTSPYFGAIVGRVANRIKNAQFKLNGKTYHLPANDGNNTLHGGKRGFDKVLWKVKRVRRGRNPSIQFTYHSYDGEQGFPGDLDVSVTYKLGHRELRVDMKAIPRNKPTPVSLAQHTYWNLAGEGSGKTVLGNLVTIWGSHYTPVNKALIPTGQILPVKGTPYDFTKQAVVGSRINHVPGGYDINYALNPTKSSHGLRHAARVKEPTTSRVLDLWTTAPGLQFYTGNLLNRTVGKGGAVYNVHSALCLESQAFPDAVNDHNFPSIIVHPGMVYSHIMVYKFSVDNSSITKSY
eukprot:Gb_09747 [translate_table: standard]